MAGGERDSSRTRVEPVFDELHAKRMKLEIDSDWVERLIGLCSRGREVLRATAVAPLKGGAAVEPRYEVGLAPPRSLLEHYLRNPGRLSWPKGKTYNSRTEASRRALLGGDKEKMQEGLAALASVTRLGGKHWFLFEGTTRVDAILETSGGLHLLVEGKRTETSLTEGVEWDRNRDQVYRGLDAGFEAFGRCCVQALIVEAGTSCEREARTLDQAGWKRAARSMPHRCGEEVERLWTEQYAGWTTWKAIQREFGLGPLVDRVRGSRQR